MLTAIVFMLVVVHGHVLEQLSLTFLIHVRICIAKYLRETRQHALIFSSV